MDRKLKIDKNTILVTVLIELGEAGANGQPNSRQKAVRCL